MAICPLLGLLVRAIGGTGKVSSPQCVAMGVGLGLVVRRRRCGSGLLGLASGPGLRRR